MCSAAASAGTFKCVAALFRKGTEERNRFRLAGIPQLLDRFKLGIIRPVTVQRCSRRSGLHDGGNGRIGFRLHGRFK